MPGSSSWMPYASHGVKGLDDDDDDDDDDTPQNSTLIRVYFLVALKYRYIGLR